MAKSNRIGHLVAKRKVVLQKHGQEAAFIPSAGVGLLRRTVEYQLSGRLNVAS